MNKISKVKNGKYKQPVVIAAPCHSSYTFLKISPTKKSHAMMVT